MRKMLMRCEMMKRHLRNHPISESLPESLSRHLAECESCREELSRQTRADRSLMDDAVAPSLPAASVLASRLETMSRIRSLATEEKSGSRAMLRRRADNLKTAFAGCATLALLFGAIRATNRRQPLDSASAILQAYERRAYLHLIRESAKGESHPNSRWVVLNADPSSETREMRGIEIAAAPRAASSFQSARSENRAFHPISPGSSQSIVGAKPSDDLAYVNDVTGAFRPETARKRTNRFARGDDFVTIPPPEIAAAGDSPATRRLIAEAIDHYEAEKAVTDPRLFKKIDVEMKGGDLKALVGALTEKSGVQFYVSKDLEDAKLTVCMSAVPVRDLMRQVVRLFDLEWRRRGEDGKYTYELTQTLKQKLAEEDLKRKDDDQMLLDVVDNMNDYLPYKDASQDELKRMADDAKAKAMTAGSAEERESDLDRARILSALAKPESKGVLEQFAALSPDQLVALRNGGEISLRYKGDGSENTLPQEVADNIISLMKQGKTSAVVGLDGKDPKDMDVEFRFGLNRDRPDKVGFYLQSTLSNKGSLASWRTDLSQGQPDQLRQPDNRSFHAAMMNQTAYQKAVSLAPSPDTPPANDLYETVKRLDDDASQPGAGSLPRKVQDWIDSADFFSELHKKTGRNVIADYYTRVYPKSAFSAGSEKLIAVLNEAADVLKSDWRDDGGILRFRRFNYYSERTMDVPNRLLARWKSSRERKGYLDLDDLSEMAMQPPLVLEHQDLRQAAAIKYGLDEWDLAASTRSALKFYASLNPEQRRAIQSDSCLSVAKLDATQLELVKSANFNADFSALKDPNQALLHLRLVPPGSYEWRDISSAPSPVFPLKPVISERTREKAEAAVDALKKAKGSPDSEIRNMKDNLYGPDAGLWVESSVDGRYGVMIHYGRSCMGTGGDIKPNS